MKGVFKIYILFISLVLLSTGALAQAGRSMIQGTVTSSTDGEGLPGATVLLVNKDDRVMTHAITDLDGNYSLLTEIREGDKLRVSYTGFKQQDVPVRNRTNIHVKLEEDAIMLGEAVIVAQRLVDNGMMSINERDMTIAATRVSMADLADNTAAASIDDALQGRIAGVDITGGSGAPGTGMSIRIRGTSSINGSAQPLIVVDGFIFDTEISDDFDFAAADEEEYSQMLSIAPEDIQEITVLKDASATALYGARAANGVLQITTKRGTKGKPKVSYTFKGTVSQKPTTIPTLGGSQYVTMVQEAYFNNTRPYSPIDRPELAYDINQPYYFYNYSQDTDWFDEVTRRGLVHDHNLSVTGGGDKAKYNLSLGYYNNQGTTIGTALQRINTRLNVDYDVSEKISFKASFTYVHNDNDKNYVTYLSSSSDVTNAAFTRMPNMSIYEYSEQGVLTGNYFSPLNSPLGNWTGKSATSPYNPVAMANEGEHKFISDRITSNLSVRYRPVEWLRYQLDVGLDVLNEKKAAFVPQTATGRPWNEVTVNRADDYDGEAFVLQTKNLVTFLPKLGDKHSLTVLLGNSTYDKSNYAYKVTSANTASPYLTDPSNPSRVNGAEIVGISSGSSMIRTVAFFGNAEYKLLDRYVINGSLRSDGDSRFGKEHQWGIFPSASLRWRISGEPFMRWADKFVDDFSMRASWGINGNSPKASYGHIGLYDIYDYSYLGEVGTYLKNMELSDLRWERTTQQNLGIDLSVLNNRLRFGVDIYKKRTNDLFFSNLGIPTSTGYSKLNMNVGTMDNQGWELSINTIPVRKRNLRVSINFNIARNQNYIREISELYPMEKGTGLSNGDYLRRYEIDQPMGSIYGYKYDGVYLNKDQTIARDKNGEKIYTYDEYGNSVPVQMRFGYPSIDYEFQPGDARYVDINNDGNIDYQDIVYLGNTNPKFTGGFGPTVTYKDFTVSAFFNFRYGNKIVNSTKITLESMSSYNNQSTATLRRWGHEYVNVADAPSDLLPRALAAGYNRLGSDRFVEDGSFLRMKSLSIKYQANRKWLTKNTPFTRAHITLLMSNLLTWTKYTGQDPEIKMRNDFNSGYDSGRIPRTKEFTLSLSAEF